MNDIYCVCWKDDRGDRGVVAGEGHMHAWAEAEEVCSYFREADDGLEYYVGDKDANPLSPTVEEARWTLDHSVKAGYIGLAEYKLFEHFIDRAADFERGREVMKEYFEELRRAKARFEDDEV